MAFDPQGINPEEQEQPVVQQGPGSVVQQRSQLATPQLAAPPEQTPPDMSQYIADKAAAAEQARQDATTMNPDQYTSAGIKNLEDRKDVTREQGMVARDEASEEAKVQADSVANQKLAQLNDELNHARVMREGKARDEARMETINRVSQEKVDPNHWWNSKTTGGKVQASIGMFLNSLGNPQLAHEQMNKAIDRDIEAQQGNIANHWKGVVAAGDVENTIAAREAHDQEWRNQYKLGAMDIVKSQLATIGASHRGDMVGSNVQNALLDINSQQDALRKANYDLKMKQAAAQWSSQAAQRKRLDEMGKEAAAHQVALMNSAAPMSEKDAHEAVGRMYPELVDYGRWSGGNGAMGTKAPVNPAREMEQEKFQFEKDNKAAASAKDITARTITLPAITTYNGKAIPGGKYLANTPTEVGVAQTMARTINKANYTLGEYAKLQTLYEAGTLTRNGIARMHTILSDYRQNYNELQDVKRQMGVAEGKNIDDNMLPEIPSLPPNWVPGTKQFNPFTEPARAKLNALFDINVNDHRIMKEQLTPAIGNPAKVDKENPDWNIPTLKPAGQRPTASSNGPAPKSIPNYQGTNGANDPGSLPSWQQYRNRQ